MTASGGWAMLVAPLRSSSSRACPASGWELHRGCTVGDGTVVCPSCSQVVEARLHNRLGTQFRVVKAHSLNRGGASR